ncbi:hypothetical protein FNF28_00687 [Cafeteria roenbergensis]|uniref:Ketoreductase domain-containing protein n=1 Tax=Cafeteria roenbergensis TaxID=33653 RepID=A0A5A8E138_CAFRO|nr:hypothetical protein FNF28_00687 [Cafeteria roenbergensis]
MSLYAWTVVSGWAASQVAALLTCVISVLDLIWSVVAPRKAAPAPRVVLITGASSGIGKALAIDYASPGMTLVLTGRNMERLREVSDACDAKGAAVILKAIDVTDESGMRDWIAAVDTDHPIDLVVANAGVSEATAAVQNDPAGAARTILPINVFGLLNTVVPLIEPMKARGRGQIAIVSSLAGFGPITSSAAYSASKAAVKTWGEALRTELLCFGVRVNVVCPGFVRSPMTAVNKFYMPGLINMDEAIACIREGLACDLPVIAFPSFTYFLAQMSGALPVAAREALARLGVLSGLFFYRRGPKGRSAAAESAGSEGAASKRD